MTDEQYKELKKDYINHIQRYIKEVGNLFPHITIFAEHKNKKENDKLAIVHFPIDNQYMESDETKDEFINEIIPEVFKTIKNDFIPLAVVWGTEAWVRTISKEEVTHDQINDYKKIPIKKEVVFVSIETKNHQESIVYDIKRKGKQVNSDGELLDIIELIEADESGAINNISGRFSGLFKLLENA